jgi:hypothetical protein
VHERAGVEQQLGNAARARAHLDDLTTPQLHELEQRGQEPTLRVLGAYELVILACVACVDLSCFHAPLV